MILIWFLFRAIKNAGGMFLNCRARRAYARQERRILGELGRKAWLLRKQHVGMEDILAKLGELEAELKKLQATIDQHEDDLYSGAPNRAGHLRQIKSAGRRFNRVQRDCFESFVLLGIAIDASRHHDAALVDYYRRIDENRQQRNDLKQDTRARVKSLLTAAPLALVELAILIALAVWVVRGAVPLFTDYHNVFTDDFQQGAARWGLSDPKAGVLAAESSVLSLKSTGADEARAFPRGMRPFENVSIRAKVRAMSEAAIAGLVFRQGGQDSYVLEFRRDRSCRVSFWMRGGQNPLSDWETPRGVDKGADEFEIELRCSGRNIWAFVDGKLAMRQKAFESYRGMVGLSISPNAEVRIARFEVGYKGLRGWIARRTGSR